MSVLRRLILTFKQSDNNQPSKSQLLEEQQLCPKELIRVFQEKAVIKKKKKKLKEKHSGLIQRLYVICQNSEHSFK